MEVVTNPSRRKCAWGRPGTSRRCLAFREQTLDPCRDPAPTAPLSPNSDSNKPEATDLIPGMTGNPNKITRISRIYLKKKNKCDVLLLTGKKGRPGLCRAELGTDPGVFLTAPPAWF